MFIYIYIIFEFISSFFIRFKTYKTLFSIRIKFLTKFETELKQSNDNRFDVYLPSWIHPENFILNKNKIFN